MIYLQNQFLHTFRDSIFSLAQSRYQQRYELDMDQVDIFSKK